MLRDSTRDLNADADLIAKGLHLNADEVRARQAAAWLPQYQPIFLKEDITPDELAFIEAHKNELPELETIMAHRRFLSAQRVHGALGRLRGEVTEDMLNQPQFESIARRCSGRQRSGETVQRHPDGEERFRRAI